MIKKSLVILLISLGFISCKKEVVKETSKEKNLQVSSVKTYTYSELKPLLEKNDGKTYIVNFWATWCAPCVKELPYFEKIKKEFDDKNVEVLLVSLDFPKQVEKKLIPFINKRKLNSKVVLLDDINEDVWIKSIDENWSGAIPATLIYNKNKRKFYEHSFDYETLEKELQTFIN
ncbi:TlpA disulfide reductase family protein [Polaribacter sp.]|uniref:TlpA disulfide reductase family protein n=1 Tax=unclassified Polaribacter TaxID=196858 RepID=UPI00052E03D1|nr:redoxin [Polaribacter sp. Hel1_33_49]MBT3740713.1 TlpA family protein disulfide reductase [Polaribacter sp.]